MTLATVISWDRIRSELAFRRLLGEPERTVEALLAPPDSVEARAAARLLWERPDCAIPQVIDGFERDILPDSTTEISSRLQARLAELFDDPRLRGAEVASLLAREAEAGTETGRGFCYFYISRMGGEAATAVPYLMRALDVETTKLRDLAWALASIGAPARQCVPKLRQRFASAWRGTETRANLAYAIWRLDADMEPLVRACSEPNTMGELRADPHRYLRHVLYELGLQEWDPAIQEVIDRGIPEEVKELPRLSVPPLPRPHTESDIRAAVESVHRLLFPGSDSK